MRLPRRPTRRLVLSALLIGAILAYALGPPFGGRLRGLTDWLFAPFGDAAMAATTALEARLHAAGAGELSLADVRRLERENRELRGKVHALEQKTADLIRHEQGRRDLFGRWMDFPCELIGARVVLADALPYGSTRVINTRGAAGVRPGLRVTTRELLTDRSKALPPGLAAVTSTALVGRITETAAFTARLELLTDRNFEIEADVRRIVDPADPRQVRVTTDTGPRLTELTEAIARRELVEHVRLRGDGAGGMVAENVKAYYGVRPGDWVQTRRDDAFLPAAVRIGEVTGVEPDPDNALFVTLRVRPHADLDSLRQVYLVCPRGGLAVP